MNSVAMRLMPLGFALAMAGCGGGGDGLAAGAFCESVSGGSAQLTSSCVGCTITQAGAAADRNLASAASATAMPGATNATATIRATAQPGVVYPAGSNAGVFYTPYSNVCSNCAVTINTYLDGAPAESRSGVNNSTGSDPAVLYTSVNALMPFDAVEIVFNGTISPLGDGLILKAFEICSSGGFR